MNDLVTLELEDTEIDKYLTRPVNMAAALVLLVGGGRSGFKIHSENEIPFPFVGEFCAIKVRMAGPIGDGRKWR